MAKIYNIKKNPIRFTFNTLLIVIEFVIYWAYIKIVRFVIGKSYGDFPTIEKRVKSKFNEITIAIMCYWLLEGKYEKVIRIAETNRQVQESTF